MSYDWRLYKADVAGSIAHATMLEKVGLITGAHSDLDSRAADESVAQWLVSTREHRQNTTSVTQSEEQRNDL